MFFKSSAFECLLFLMIFSTWYLQLIFLVQLSTSCSDPSKVSQILKFALSVKLNSKLLLTIADNQTLH